MQVSLSMSSFSGRKIRMIRTRGTKCLVFGSLRPRANHHVQIRLLRHIRCICVLCVLCVPVFLCVEIHWQRCTNLEEGATTILNCSIMFYWHFCKVVLTSAHLWEQLFNATMNTCIFNVPFNASLSFIEQERTKTRKQNLINLSVLDAC